MNSTATNGNGKKANAAMANNNSQTSQNSQHSEGGNFSQMSEEEWTATQEFMPKEEEVKQSPAASTTWGRLLSQDPRFGHIDLQTTELTVGRRKECSVTFSDLRVSGKHCRIFRANTDLEAGTIPIPSIFVEDLSSNGTFLNGKVLGKGNRSTVNNGDEISLVAKRGNTDCIMSYVFQDLSMQDSKEESDESEITKLYDIQKVLGTGNFSVVKLGVNRKTGERCAVKIIDKKKYWNTKNLEQIEREVEILKQIKHDNIISIIDIISTERYLYILLELASGGELFDTIVEKGSYTEEEARDVFIQMLDAVAYLHRRGIAHRDLKPENILLATRGSNKIKITDFGLARIVPEREMMTTLCGTPQYVAPEIIKQSTWTPEQCKAKGGYGKEVDLWSLGGILYVLLSGFPPFDEEREVSLYDQIERGMYEFPLELWCEVSEPGNYD
eukprot:TRINITY_DN4193_c0_g1_i3.p1 TRINITY_DN4193_c0_g1~~TRINITY_DN4193_c0_g1_i3.p1  ORF type:complete len:442 (+),score=128.56 TRINITY_DN4193_c0_g1_i3:262-1587(+)